MSDINAVRAYSLIGLYIVDIKTIINIFRLPELGKKD